MKTGRSQPIPVEKEGTVHDKKGAALCPKLLDERYAEVCLVDSLKARRYKVRYTRCKTAMPS